MSHPVVDDPIAWCVATALQQCYCAQLAEVSLAVNCCCLLPGQQAVWDTCDSGQAWVRVASVYQVGHTFPQAARPQDLGVCGGDGGWAVTLELGALRCMPQPDERGNLPTCDQMSEVTRLVLADGNAMRRALLCCEWPSLCGLDDPQRVYGPWTPVGPQGTCVGGVTSVTVQVSACVCPEQDGGRR